MIHGSDNDVEIALIKKFFARFHVGGAERRLRLNRKSNKVVLASTDSPHYVAPRFRDDEGAVKIVHG
jgi:hypothetical protein